MLTRSDGQHFSSLLDRSEENPYFAIEVEYKFVGAFRDLLIKQARQHRIVTNAVSPECRVYQSLYRCAWAGARSQFSAD